MKRILLLTLSFLVCLLAIGFSLNQPVVFGEFAPDAFLAPDFQRPIHGWTVCADLGSGLIPGVGTRQRFQVCEGSGWELLTYCLETEKPAPAVGVMCSFVNSSDLWCGESVQLVRVYTVLQTPAPTPTRTQTPTSTRTSTPTRTPSPTLTTTGTAIPTRSSTFLSRQTQQVSTAVIRNTSQVPVQGTRPIPGGPGNLEAVILPAGLGGIAILAVGSIIWLTARHRKAMPRRDDYRS